MTFHRVANSLATRIILLGVGVVLLGSVLRFHVFGNYLREDISAVMAAQQQTLAHYVARDIESKMQERQVLLQQIANTLPVALLDDPAQLREWLATRHALQSLFSEGFMVTAPNGRLIADFPQRAERAQANFSDREHIRRARDEGLLTIGSPVIGRAVKKPILPMSIPVRDASGRIQAILSAATALDSTGFLSFNSRERIGEGGGFLLVSPRDRLFVASTEPAMVLQPTPADGVNPLHDRAMQGYRGTGITVNAKGVEEIAAIASVPSTGWFVVARIPTSEALSVVTRTQHFIARASVLSVVVFLLLATAGLIYVFRPLLHAADHADRMTRGEAPLEPLAVVRQDEVGHLTEAFNRLLRKLQTSQSEMAHMAHHDPLTGLPNRALLADRLTQAIARAARSGSRLCLLYIDLDRFKPVNDTLGHEAGDAALVEIARRLSAIVRESDTLARVGGDEFVVLLGDLDSLPDQAEKIACAVAAKCLDTIETPLSLRGQQHTIGASIGIAMGDGQMTPHALQMAADSAMYRAKQSGGQRFFIATGTGLRSETIPAATG